jgi:hypothetical protein
VLSGVLSRTGVALNECSHKRWLFIDHSMPAKGTAEVPMVEGHASRIWQTASSKRWR